MKMDSLMIFNIGAFTLLAFIMWYAYQQAKKEKEEGD